LVKQQDGISDATHRIVDDARGKADKVALDGQHGRTITL
jgi:hypothetical protein